MPHSRAARHLDGPSHAVICTGRTVRTITSGRRDAIEPRVTSGGLAVHVSQAPWPTSPPHARRPTRRPSRLPPHAPPLTPPASLDLGRLGVEEAPASPLLWRLGAATRISQRAAARTRRARRVRASARGRDERIRRNLVSTRRGRRSRRRRRVGTRRPRCCRRPAAAHSTPRRPWARAWGRGVGKTQLLPAAMAPRRSRCGPAVTAASASGSSGGAGPCHGESAKRKGGR